MLCSRRRGRESARARRRLRRAPVARGPGARGRGLRAPAAGENAPKKGRDESALFFSRAACSPAARPKPRAGARAGVARAPHAARPGPGPAPRDAARPGGRRQRDGRHDAAAVRGGVGAAAMGGGARARARDPAILPPGLRMRPGQPQLLLLSLMGRDFTDVRLARARARAARARDISRGALARSPPRRPTSSGSRARRRCAQPPRRERRADRGPAARALVWDERRRAVLDLPRAAAGWRRVRAVAVRARAPRGVPRAVAQGEEGVPRVQGRPRHRERRQARRQARPLPDTRAPRAARREGRWRRDAARASRAAARLRSPTN